MGRPSAKDGRPPRADSRKSGGMGAFVPKMRAVIHADGRPTPKKVTS
jgi:hypothetical protein